MKKIYNSQEVSGRNITKSYEINSDKSFTLKLLITFLSLIVALFISSKANAAGTVTWIGTTSTAWETAANWKLPVEHPVLLPEPETM